MNHRTGPWGETLTIIIAKSNKFYYAHVLNVSQVLFESNDRLGVYNGFTNHPTCKLIGSFYGGNARHHLEEGIYKLAELY